MRVSLAGDQRVEQASRPAVGDLGDPSQKSFGPNQSGVTGDAKWLDRSFWRRSATTRPSGQGAVRRTPTPGLGRQRAGGTATLSRQGRGGGGGRRGSSSARSRMGRSG